MSSTIFVQIAAYRDPDLPATLHNLIQRAAQPELLRFGICCNWRLMTRPTGEQARFRIIHT